MQSKRGGFQLSYALLTICHWIVAVNGRRRIYVTVKENESIEFSDYAEGSDIESIEYSDGTIICNKYNGIAKSNYTDCEDGTKVLSNFSSKSCSDVTIPKVKLCMKGLYRLILLHNKESPWQLKIYLTVTRSEESTTAASQVHFDRLNAALNASSYNNTSVDESQTFPSSSSTVAVVCVVGLFFMAVAAFSCFVYKRKKSSNSSTPEEQNSSANESSSAAGGAKENLLGLQPV